MGGALFPPPGTIERWAKFIVVGDSFSEGLWDPYPLDDGTLVPDGTESDARQRGWADRLATALSARRVAAGLPELLYANLAIRGKLIGQIAVEQLPDALAQKPDLISVMGGGNDILRPGVDIDTISDQLDSAVAAARQAGADVLMCTGFKASRTLAWTRGAVGQFNSNIWAIAREHGAYVLDLWTMKCLGDLRLWSDDRIHLNSEGHRRVMNAALRGLGLSPDDDDYDALLPPEPEPEPVERVEKVVGHDRAVKVQARALRLKGDAQWAGQHAAPWIARRAERRSSGDGREAKYPTANPWPPQRGSCGQLIW